jgi:hypothetical protein
MVRRRLLPVQRHAVPGVGAGYVYAVKDDAVYVNLFARAGGDRALGVGDV